ncbi:MAG: flagellar basal-body rod protein FlgG, partial [Candidatus Omnitrophica bacterium]|nr:flagellar basal-body rod protein FlgG [Candidatus Omnitrophota bacterium]
ATGMYGQQVNIDVISNNLANVNTTGFKKSRVDFKDLFYQVLKFPGTPLKGGELEIPTGSQIGLGVKPDAIFKIFSTEGYQETQNPLDLAIEGDGFFQIELIDGTTAYTRDGSFKIDSEGRIVTSQGYRLLPEITIPDDTVSIAISKDGGVSILRAGQTNAEELGTIELVRFINPAGLKSIGDNLYLETDASGIPILGNPGEEGLGMILQGFLESSNVNIVEEMVKMIIAQRAYEVNSRAVQTSDDMLSIANNLKR